MQEMQRPRKSRGAYKFDAAKRSAFLDLLTNGVGRIRAARACGIDPSTAWRHMQEDDDFAEQVSIAEMDAAEAVEKALFDSAIGGNVTAMQVYLYNRCPSRWKDQRGRALAEASPMDEDDAKEVLANVLGVEPEEVPDELARMRKRNQERRRKQ